MSECICVGQFFHLTPPNPPPTQIVHRFNKIPINISTRFFFKIQTNYSKRYTERQKKNTTPRIVKTPFKRRNRTSLVVQ